jgi:hypothetical protein
MADQRYQTRFSGYEEEPSSDVWSGIEAQLNQHQSALQQQAYWLSGLLAVLVAGSTIFGIWIFSSDQAPSRMFDPQALVLRDTFENNQDELARIKTQESVKLATSGTNAQSAPLVSKGEQHPVSGRNNFSGQGPASKPANNKASHKGASANSELEKKPVLTAHGLPTSDGLSPTKAPTDLALGSERAKGQRFDPTKQWRMSLLAGAFRQFSHQQISAAYADGLLTQFENTTSQSFGIEAILMGTYQLNQHWSARGGMGVMVTQQDFAFQPLALGKRGDAPDGDATTDEPVTEAASPDAGDLEPITATNRIAYLSIPLRVRYQFSMSRFEVGLEGGLSVNRLIRAQGKLLNPANQQVQELSVPGGPLRQWQTRIVARPSVSYQVSPQIQVNLATKAGVSLSSRYQDAFPVSDQPTRLGLQTGLSYTF